MLTVEEQFEEGLKRYEAGEPAANLLDTFRAVVEKQPGSGPAHTCLAWLYLLVGDEARALKVARQAAKLAPTDAQTHVNLALAMLDSGQKGVREPIDRARQVLSLDTKQVEEVRKNCDEGLQRRADWTAMQKVRKWLFEE